MTATPIHKPHEGPSPSRRDEIEMALADGIRMHFEHRRNQVPDFIENHLRYPGCWQTNRRAFGFDLLKAPLNLLWAPIYIVLILLLTAGRFLGVKKGLDLARRLPAGFTTNVQKFLNVKIREELIATDQLSKQVFLALEPVMRSKSDGLHSDQERQNLHKHIETIVADAMKQLMTTRIASSDITNTVLSTALGALAFKKFTPGGIGIGLLLAAYWAQEQAKSSFFLGSTVGGWYYTLFPAKPSIIETGIGIAVVLLVLAVFASFSGLLTDPLQSRLGLHKRRLTRMLCQLEKDILQRSQNRFKPLDPYVARILELLDTLKPFV